MFLDMLDQYKELTFYMKFLSMKVETILFSLLISFFSMIYFMFYAASYEWLDVLFVKVQVCEIFYKLKG
jgi:hypothetical protein